ncbi:MAG TPA: SDR family oxidoreductase, partial [Streptosporangiaceae bacterium]
MPHVTVGQENSTGIEPRNSGTRRGHVVNISTSLVDHANTAVPSALASLTKGGLNAVTRSLAIEYAASGVRVN